MTNHLKSMLCGIIRIASEIYIEIPVNPVGFSEDSNCVLLPEYYKDVH